ncbi:MAG: metallophosphoesterase [Clostridia bacterium]|nr:metallophosphoesterase [Clostridia bacterium]
MMKLIHCADLHLDSPMESNLPAEKARERRSEILSTFAELVRHADENGADAILIAGDLFDSKRTTRKTEQYVLELIKKHPALSFFYLAGNHDSGSSLSTSAQLPENLYTFGNEWTSYALGDVYITGSEQPDPSTLELPEGKINILLLHGQQKETGTAGADIIPFRQYRNRHIDYMALGHLHAYREATLDDRGVACYSGCPEGRGFDECGQKGYVLLEIAHQKVTHTFVPFARRTLHEITCDLSGCETQLEIENRLLTATEGIPSSDLIKIILIGSCSPQLLMDLPRLQQLLSERFYFVKPVNRTHLEIHPEDYAHDISLKGEFVRRVMASSFSKKQKEEIIACGFRALGGEELDI